MSEKIKQFEGRSTDRNDKKVTYAHREDPNGCRFIDFANSVPGWAVDIQQYVEEEQKTMNANEMADAVYKKYCNSMDDLADKTATMLRQQQSRIEELELQMGMIEGAKDAIAKTRGEV